MLAVKFMSAAPTISVIVVCKNPGPRLPTALASVWCQRQTQPELIVIDGGSTDGTTTWLEAQRDRISAFVSEPDRGIYDAMNKGVASAHGDWLLFLGADDQLAGDQVLNEALASLTQSDAGVVVGEAIYEDGRIRKLQSSLNPRSRNFLHHQAAFYRRTLFAENGGYDDTLAVMGDYDLNVRLWKNQVRFRSMPLRVTTCGMGGTSDSGRWLGYREEIRVRHRHYPAWQCWIWDAGSVARYLRKKILRSIVRQRPDHRPTPMRPDEK